jgi:hypothetical protein
VSLFSCRHDTLEHLDWECGRRDTTDLRDSQNLDLLSEWWVFQNVATYYDCPEFVHGSFVLLFYSVRQLSYVGLSGKICSSLSLVTSRTHGLSEKMSECVCIAIGVM